MVADLEPPRRWREHTSLWAEILDGDRQRAVDAAVLLAGGLGVGLAALPLHTGLPPTADADVDRSDLIGTRLFAPSVRAAARGGIIEYLRRAHAETPRSPGVSLESVRAALSALFAPVLLEHALADLEREGDIVRAGPEVRLLAHQVRLTTREQTALDRVAEILAQAELSPPSPARLTELTGVDRSLINDVLRILVDSGRLIAVNPEVYLIAEAEARLISGARSVLEHESPASPAAFGDELGLSRRVLIPLLEYLDRLAVTRRTPRGRVRGDDQST
jgi:selenocysteine-specific elongation factor